VLLHRVKLLIIKLKPFKLLTPEWQPFNKEKLGQILLLVTCYPFNSVMTGGPLLFVGTADAIQKS
jgi:hypothetical protein